MYSYMRAGAAVQSEIPCSLILMGLGQTLNVADNRHASRRHLSRPSGVDASAQGRHTHTLKLVGYMLVVTGQGTLPISGCMRTCSHTRESRALAAYRTDRTAPSLCFSGVLSTIQRLFRQDIGQANSFSSFDDDQEMVGNVYIYGSFSSGNGSSSQLTSLFTQPLSHLEQLNTAALCSTTPTITFTMKFSLALVTIVSAVSSAAAYSPNHMRAGTAGVVASRHGIQPPTPVARDTECKTNAECLQKGLPIKPAGTRSNKARQAAASAIR